MKWLLPAVAGSPRAPAAASALTAEEEGLRGKLRLNALVSSSFVLELETREAPAAAALRLDSATAATAAAGGGAGPPSDPLVHPPSPSGAGSAGGGGVHGGGGAAVVRRYLVGQGCCGQATPAWRLAAEGTAEAGTPLVPWGAVALPLQAAGEGEKGRRGWGLPVMGVMGGCSQWHPLRVAALGCLNRWKKQR